MLAKRPTSSAIEPLESRIAPALLVNGANLLGGSSPHSGETSVGDHSITLVKVLSGQAIVWFDGDDITSISVGPGVSLEITGDVTGDIVGNLTAAGTLSDSDNNPANGDDGGVLLPNDILGIKTRSLSAERGSVGHIITGGSVTNVTIAGSIEGIYAGDGVFRTESRLLPALPNPQIVDSPVGIDINPVQPGLQLSFSLAKSAALPKGGASISNVKLAQAVQLQAFAGNGSPTGAVAAGNGAAGGNITNLTIDNASVPPGAPLGTPSYHLIAGDGQDGKKGGAGGTINKVIENSSSGPVFIQAGHGGDGAGGAGGGGGSVLNLDLQSASALYTVKSGNGGAGTPGGAGGRMVNNNFSNRTPIAGVLVSADFDGDGFDDVLVADSGTGQMVLNLNDGNGASFTQVQQQPGDVIIPAAGVNPVDALATDVDGDGKTDLMVLYKDGTMSAYLNHGGGVFYDAGDSKFDIYSGALGFAPQKFTLINPGSSLYAIAENANGGGILHATSFYVSGTTLVFTPVEDVLKTPLPIVDLVNHFIGLTDGTIGRFDIGGGVTTNIVLSQTVAPAGTGGLVDLDIDSNFTHLLALSGVGQRLDLYDVSAANVTLLGSVALTGVTGRPVMAKFTSDNDPATIDDNQVAVLSNTINSAQLTQFVPVPAPNTPGTPYVPFAQGAQIQSTSLLKNFAPVYEKQVRVDFAALAGPLNNFTLLTGYSSEEKFPLPFASKQVKLTAGDGGAGIDVGTKIGKGGAGGSVIGLNADAQIITVQAGLGGNSMTGAAGAGGSISNAINAAPLDGSPVGSFKTAGGTTVLPRLVAEATLTLTTGKGGAPGGAGKTAAGGAGGDLNGLDLTLTTGDILLTAADGGAGNGAAGGAGGDIIKVKTIANGGSLTVTAGMGGAAIGAAGNGGAGGVISGLNHELTLDADAEKNEQAYAVTLTAGAAGASANGIGGAGGSISGVTLKLDGADSTFDDATAVPPLVDAHLDTTVTVTVTAGAGGDGAKTGGAGGGIQSFSSESFFDQVSEDGLIRLNAVVLGLFAGKGGNATAGNGGAGGAITLTKPISGVSGFDPDQPGYDPTVPALILVGGAGGNGTVKGGAGGAVAGLVAQNAPGPGGEDLKSTELFSAALIGGAGGTGGTGDGGVGGNVANTLIGVYGGNLAVAAGAGGGSANAKGGAGGAVLNSEFGFVGIAPGLQAPVLFPLGMSVAGGGGGAGKTAGGAGGGLSGLRVNTPQSTSVLSAILLAGSGGAANSAGGLGGKGGDINGVTQAKDYNSSINLIQAGNGGANPLGKGGAGGNVLNVRTVGFIGRSSDSVGNQLGVFDSSMALVDDDLDGSGPGSTPPVVTQIFPTIAQGLFAGVGGAGSAPASNGINGSVSNIAARQIAAIAAAPNLGTGLFAAAAKVSNVTTALIGFDIDGDGACDDQTNTPIVPGTASPATVKPADGFILAKAIAQVTGARAAFTFIV